MKRENADRVILLAEDNPRSEELTLRAFKTCGIANPIVVARDGVEVLDYLFARGAHAHRPEDALPLLILLDLNLPKLHGLEVLRALRQDQRTKLLPVVILSSSVREEDLVRGYSLGANSFVRKPVDFVIFCESIRHLGQYWIAMNEVVPPWVQSKE